jgi:hypothetical protein
MDIVPGNNHTNATHFDVPFRRPGGNADECRTNGAAYSSNFKSLLRREELVDFSRAVFENTKEQWRERHVSRNMCSCE